tara:strand:+ start:576 stop:905 length:330 start_codon:yes stop_codon:yes gene_type:complete
MKDSELQNITQNVKKVLTLYQEEYPDVVMDRDYYPFKLTEEWGECLQMYLMLTNRGRQKGKTEDEIKVEFSKEIADVFGYLLAFADSEGIDLKEELENKWFAYLKKGSA